MVSNTIHALNLNLRMSADSTLNANKQSEYIYKEYFEEAINKVIEQYGEKYDLLIPNIEIDLQQICKEDVPAALEKALREEIEKHIQKKSTNGSLHPYTYTNYSNVERLGKIESLIAYLTTGETPWEYESKIFNPKTYFSDILVFFKDKNTLLYFYQQIKENVVAVTRLNQIASFSQLKELEKEIARVVNSDNLQEEEKRITTTDFGNNDLQKEVAAELINGEIVFTERILNTAEVSNKEEYVPKSSLQGNTNTKQDDSTEHSFIEEQNETKKGEITETNKQSDDKINIGFDNPIAKSKGFSSSESSAIKNEGSYIDNRNNNKQTVTDGETLQHSLALSESQKEENLENLFKQAQTYSDFPTIKDNRIHTETAGLVLLNPFIFSYFQRLNLLNEEHKFKSVNEAMRAVHLLNYLAGELDPEKASSLSLEKVMCGLDTNFPVETDFEILPNEKEEAENLLTTVCTRWKPLNNTSIDGLQRCFLQRHGTIEYDESMILIRVEGNTLDILMEDLPWGTSMFLFPWVKTMFYVEWQAAE